MKRRRDCTKSELLITSLRDVFWLTIELEVTAVRAMIILAVLGGARDFGAFDHAGAHIFWKIDYYDATLTAGSQDPSDPKQTVRVPTTMLASEY